MGKECKHQWRWVDKKHFVDTGKTLYVFYCIKCLKFRKIGIEDYEKL
jgi:hypothetical protein